MARKPKESAGASELLNAIKFASIAFNDDREAFAAHVIMREGWLYSFDGMLATGCKISDELSACPQGTALQAALARCAVGVALTVTEGALHVSSGRFRVSVPCLDFGALRAFSPDPVGTVAGPELVAAFAALAPLVSETASTILESALCLEGGFASATNRKVVGQYWHGLQLPWRVLLPRSAIMAVKNCGKELSGYGMTQQTATFWFKDGSWLRTQLLHDERYPTFDKLFTIAGVPADLPEGFTDAIFALAPFTNDEKKVLFDSDGLHSQGKTPATYKVDGPKESVAFSVEMWNTLSKYVTQADWNSNPAGIMVFGPNMRGLVGKMRI